ncbi:MAG: phosphoribosylglycinamide formyltransferase [Oscillospiraceae bacterium]
MTSIAVLCSGGGTNLQALIDAQKRGELAGGEIKLVIASKPSAFALERAKSEGIPTAVIGKRDFADLNGFDEAVLAALRERDIQLVVLAGYLSILGPKTLAAYEHRILNVHPALIPSFCGMGFYGLRVHEAALEYGVKVTGATVHFVSEVVDGGEIVLQKAVDVLPGDTPETLQKRVMKQAEWVLLPRAVAMFCRGEIGKKGNEADLR